MEGGEPPLQCYNEIKKPSAYRVKLVLILYLTSLIPYVKCTIHSSAYKFVFSIKAVSKVLRSFI